MGRNIIIITTHWLCINPTLAHLLFMGEMRAPGAAQGTTQLVLIVNASLHLYTYTFIHYTYIYNIHIYIYIIFIIYIYIIHIYIYMYNIGKLIERDYKPTLTALTCQEREVQSVGDVKIRWCQRQNPFWFVVAVGPKMGKPGKSLSPL